MLSSEGTVLAVSLVPSLFHWSSLVKLGCKGHFVLPQGEREAPERGPYSPFGVSGDTEAAELALHGVQNGLMEYE